MSRISKGQIAELILKDQRGELGEGSLEDLNWLFDRGGQNWRVVITGPLSGALVTTQKDEGTADPARVQVVSEWLEFFGHLRIWDSDFNENNYPLGEDPSDGAEEFSFNQVVSGHEVLAEFGCIKRQGASLWAQGRYIKAHPEAQKEHPLLGIGAQWQDRHGYVYFPIFDWDDGRPNVSLCSLDDKYDPSCRFLLRKVEGI